MAEADGDQRRPLAGVSVLARRWRLFLLLAIPIAAGALIGANTLGRSYEGVAVVTFSPRPNVLVGGDVLRLTIPRYATLATARTTADAVRVSADVGADVHFAVRAEIPPESINLYLTVNADSADVAARLANGLADHVVQATEDDDLLTGTVLVAATVPAKTSGPPRVLVLVAVFTIAIAVAAAIVLVIELLHPRAWTAADTSAATGAAVLGVIPKSQSVRSDLIRAANHGALSNQVRALRWQIDSLHTAGQAPVLVVTSPYEDDGKTTVAGLLAVSLAQLGRRVALVDGDFGSADLTQRLRRVFRPAPTRRKWPWRPRPKTADQLPPPLAPTLTARDPLAISERWWRSSIPGLMFLPASPEPTDGDALAPLVDDLFEALRFEKDWVVVDAPALFDDHSPEVLVAAADMVLVVIRVGTRRRAVKATANVLAGVGAPVVGVVLNRSNDLPS